MGKQTPKYYKFVVQRNYQFETHDADGNKSSDITELEWRVKVSSEIKTLVYSGSITELFYIFHDRDINDDGTSKGLHVHICASLKIQKTITSAVNFFGASSVHNCQHMKDYTSSIRYLIHVSDDALNEHKYIYSVDDVHGWRVSDDGVVEPTTVTDFKDAMAKTGKRRARKQQKAIKDNMLLSVGMGEAVVPDVREAYLEDSHKVGFTYTDYLQDKTLYERANAEYLQMLGEFYQTHPCPLTSIYISGGGGVGKTTLANRVASRLADSHGIHQVASPGRNTTFDFAGNYRGERVSIFNEFSSAFPVEQFLSVFDPLNAMPVNSRNVDKLYFANYALFTTSVPVENFIYNLTLPYLKHNAKIPIGVRNTLMLSGADEYAWQKNYLKYLPAGDDKLLQVRRRIPILVDIKPETVSNGQVKNVATVYVLSKYDNVNDSFAYVQPNNNPYQRYKRFIYDVNDVDSIDNQTDALVDGIINAVEYYYTCNGYKKPDSFEKPNFKKLVEK